MSCGVDMLLQYVNSAQTNHKAPPKPERDHRPVSLMQINKELVQTSTVHNIWKITIFSSVGVIPGIPAACLEAG